MDKAYRRRRGVLHSRGSKSGETYTALLTTATRRDCDSNAARLSRNFGASPILRSEVAREVGQRSNRRSVTRACTKHRRKSDIPDGDAILYGMGLQRIHDWRLD